MGAEHSQQRLESDGHEILGGTADSSTSTSAAAAAAVVARRPGKQRSIPNKETVDTSPSPVSRASSPPLSVCSDLPYVSYTDRPIGENNSPKIKNKGLNSTRNTSTRRPMSMGAKPKRPQTQSGHIVIVKPGARDNDDEEDPDLSRLRSIPQFLPVLRESITTATFTRDPEVLERLNSQHMLNICSRLQMHLNFCATHISTEQNRLVERTKVVSNSITTLFASFVDMQKTYASYAEHFAKVRGISQQLSRCNSLLNENIASIEAINEFLDVEDRLEPFVWCTDGNKMRGRAESELAASSSRLRRDNDKKV